MVSPWQIRPKETDENGESVFYVAVLPSGQVPSTEAVADDFTWVKCESEFRCFQVKEQVSEILKIPLEDFSLITAVRGEPKPEEFINAFDLNKKRTVVMQLTMNYALAKTNREPLQTSSSSVLTFGNDVDDTEASTLSTPSSRFDSTSPRPDASTPFPKPGKEHGRKASSSKLWIDWKSAYKQHFELYFGAISDLEFKHVHHQKSYEIIAELGVPLSLFEKYKPDVLPGEFKQRLKQWQFSSTEGHQLLFNTLDHADMGHTVPMIEECESSPGSIASGDSCSIEDESEPDAGEYEATEQVPVLSFDLQGLIQEHNIDKVEILIKSLDEYLAKLKTLFQDSKGTLAESRKWLTSIKAIRTQHARTRTVIGIVGSTGSGKSSMINALLDEEQLVPTNSMRACTAVVTEISYNHEDGFANRAEVEFISKEAWAAELEQLYGDLIDSRGNISAEATDKNTAAGVAYDKLQAIYPQKSRDQLANATAEELIKDVLQVLGVIQRFGDNNAFNFYGELRKYVDSKEKIKSTSKNAPAPPAARELWPLIKVVRIYTKASFLASGVVIADLPGVQDANAARAAVAESYMKECAHLFICAPIIRAVDDKAAKNLLGKAFKQQLKLDGGYNDTTFICTKTDDINNEEVSRSFGLEGNEIFQARAESLTEYDDLQARSNSLETEIEEKKDLVERLNQEIEDHENPDQKPKRKRRRLTNKGRTVTQRPGSGDNLDGYVLRAAQSRGTGGSTRPGLEVEVPNSTEPRYNSIAQDTPTPESIKAIVVDLKEKRTLAIEQRTDLEEQLDDLEDRQDVLREDHAERRYRIERMGIDARNNYCVENIRNDFASGIRELDQETAQEEDDFDPDEELRDYDQVGRSLPVFCVSSRAYQRVLGRMAKDRAVPGYICPEDTQIPQLRAHCQKLAGAARLVACRALLTHVSQVLNGLGIFCTPTEVVSLNAEERHRQESRFKDALEALSGGFERSANTLGLEIDKQLVFDIFNMFEEAISSAAEQARVTCERWGSPVNRRDRAAGGYAYSTYMAICRRDGVYSNSYGHHDTNAQLLDPFMARVAEGWTKIFNGGIQRHLTDFKASSIVLLDKFHGVAAKEGRKTRAGTALVAALEAGLPVTKSIIQGKTKEMLEQTKKQQRDISRHFVDSVTETMLEVYRECASISGKGAFSIMKEAMEQHVEHHGHQMFKRSAQQVKSLLTRLFKEVKSKAITCTEAVYRDVEQSYTGAVLGTGAVLDPQKLQQRCQLQASVLQHLRRAQSVFEAATQDDMSKAPEAEPEVQKFGDLTDLDTGEQAACSKSQADVTVKLEVMEAARTDGLAAINVPA